MLDNLLDRANLVLGSGKNAWKVEIIRGHTNKVPELCAERAAG